MVVLGDIKELAEIDMGNYLVAAVPNYYQDTVAQTQFIQGKCPIGLDNKAYLSGQLLINCKQWRQENTRKSLQNFVNKHKVLDEAALNIVCQKRIYELDMEWCFPANRVDSKYHCPKLLRKYNIKNAKLLHWAGKDKPWSNLKTRNYEYYKKYL